MVDAVQGILGIEWIDGRSVRFLLGSGEEDDVIVEEHDGVEDEVEQEIEEEDPLAEYKVTKGTSACCSQLRCPY